MVNCIEENNICFSTGKCSGAIIFSGVPSVIVVAYRYVTKTRLFKLARHFESTQQQLLAWNIMSNRAEGCGQWLSANTKRRETKLAPLQGGKTKKTKKKKNFSNLAPRPIIQISNSPLSPRTVKKLRNAKQTKLNRFFKADGRPNSNGCLKNNSAAPNREDDLEKNQVKIPVKRHRDNSSSGI